MDRERPEYHSQTDVLEAMDQLGVDKTILVGQQMLMIGKEMVSDDERAIKYAEAYTECLLDNIVDPDKGISVPHKASSDSCF